MSVSFDEMLRDVVQKILRDELPTALRSALDAAMPQMRSLRAAHEASRPGDASERASLLTVREVALELKVTEPTIREWIRAGELRADRFGGRGQKRLLRVTRASLDEFKSRRAAGGGDETASVEEQAANILSAVRSKGARR